MINFRTKFFFAAVVLIFGINGVGCERHSENNSSTLRKSDNLYQGKIIIGTETWPGYFPLYVARDKEFFRDAGLDVEIKRYVALGELSKDYVAGKMQGRANLTLDAVNEHLSGLDHKVVLAIDYSNGSDAIVAKNEIVSVQDFKGKYVGFEPKTLEEFFVIWALHENDLQLSDVTPIYGNPEKTMEQLVKGEVDVAVSHEPFLSKFIKTGNFHVVYSSADTPGLITDILTFRTDFIKAHPETVEAIIQAYFKAFQFWKEHPSDANAMLAKEFGDTPEGIAEQLLGIQMLDQKDNRNAFTFAAGLQSLYGNLRKVGQFVREQVGMESALDTDALVDPTFVRKLTDGSNPQ